MRVSLFLIPALLLLTSAFGDSVGKKAEDNSVEAQLKAFRVHEDFEVNLFADETMGIANPVAMHWDEKGRLWVLTTLTYAQLEPGESPNDTLVILEDADGDGKADKSTVFAHGLDMPMGFALGYGGVYLGEGADLLFLQDTDGDDQADTREVLLTGFGTGDTHQNISNFTWGPDGCLYFSQGLHCFSRVETPWGIVRGDTAGFFRFHPKTFRLEPFCFPSLASQNPCGIVFDKTGALFIKSNNKELIYATPGLIPTDHQKNLGAIASIGSTPGKSMGGEYVESAHLPDWIQNHILIAGYYSHRVSAFPLKVDGAGYAPVTPVEILYSEHGSFRPVEIRTGPDGAIYVADWFNPIIGHYQASLRHPDRDEEHGRIWRLTAKGRDLLKPENWSVNSPNTSYKAPGVNEIAKLVKSQVPRERLDGIVAAANTGSISPTFGIHTALQALDKPRDRFIDYALEQTVHALAPDWMPEVQSGDFSFANPEHLAFALETLGGEQALEVARKKLQDDSISQKARVSLSRVLARTGTPEDLLDLLRADGIEKEVLVELVKVSQNRKVRPAAGFVPVLKKHCESESPLIRVSAIQLAGAWKVQELSEEVWAVLDEPSGDNSFHVAAVKAIASIEGKKAIEPLLSRMGESQHQVKVAMIDALLPLAPERIAEVGVSELAKVGTPEDTIPLVSPFFGRKGGPGAFLAALEKQPPSPELAGLIVASMSRLGQSDDSLLGFLQDTMGVTSGGRAYSPEFVNTLAAEVSKKGDPGAGKEIYQRAELTCAACHQLGGVGGLIGPSLDTVGAGLPADLLIESVLWPQRQLKEGYFAVAATTKGGDTLSGYREKEEDGVFYLRDAATSEVTPIPRTELSKLDNIGSLMPQGLTNGLSREELRDLIAYLASLKG